MDFTFASKKMIGHENINFERFSGREIAVFHFSSALEPILRFSIQDYDDVDDDGWLLSFIGVREVQMKPSWTIDRIVVRTLNPDKIECSDGRNGFKIICGDIALIPESEAY